MTGEDCFNQLNPILQMFIIEKLKWGNFTEIQEKTIPLILKENNTLVISPTASGKTEAVLIPIFEDIISNKLESACVLYISPLKALINDMYDRIEQWCDYFNLRVMKWHGDVSQYKKNLFIQSPNDFLLITPESLEVILFNKTFKEKEKIFKNIKYIIVDEIHYFIESERGIQLNSVLKRLERYISNEPIKLGLSATIGNPNMVSQWIGNNTQIVEYKESTDFYYKILMYSDELLFRNIKMHIGRNEKILIFVSSRSNAEELAYKIKKNIYFKNIFIHHSSIDKKEREESEKKFKYSTNAILICTTTLELGIDIGNIYAIFQIGPAPTVNSLVQRLGRSGRLNNERRLKLFYNNKSEVLIALAEISLMEKGIIEKLNIIKKPKDIYFHQILSIMVEYGKITKKDLYNLLKDAFVFKNILKEDFEILIDDMINNNFLFEHGDYLVSGDSFEKEFGKINFLNFYSVFVPSYEYKIYSSNGLIGTVEPLFILNLNIGDVFILNGQQWLLTRVESKKFKAHVEKISLDEKNVPVWFSGYTGLNYLISREVYNILLNNFNQKLLEKVGSKFDNKSKIIIDEFINESNRLNFKKGIIPIEINEYVCIYTFAGYKANTLLCEVIKNEINISLVKIDSFLIKFNVDKTVTFETIKNILDNIENILENEEFKINLNKIMNRFIKNKFIHLMDSKINYDLNMEILYDEKHLIQLISENKLKEIPKTELSSWILEYEFN